MPSRRNRLQLVPSNLPGIRGAKYRRDVTDSTRGGKRDGRRETRETSRKYKQKVEGKTGTRRRRRVDAAEKLTKMQGVRQRGPLLYVGETGFRVRKAKDRRFSRGRTSRIHRRHAYVTYVQFYCRRSHGVAGETMSCRC